MVRYHSEFLAGLDVVNLRQLIGVLTLQENAQTILANTMRVMETLPATYRQQEELVKAKRQNRVAMPSLDGIRLDIQRLQETLSSQASKTDLTLNLHLDPVDPAQEDPAHYAEFAAALGLRCSFGSLVQ